MKNTYRMHVSIIELYYTILAFDSIGQALFQGFLFSYVV
jgi:hypothetical protein